MINDFNILPAPATILRCYCTKSEIHNSVTHWHQSAALFVLSAARWPGGRGGGGTIDKIICVPQIFILSPKTVLVFFHYTIQHYKKNMKSIIVNINSFHSGITLHPSIHQHNVRPPRQALYLMCRFHHAYSRLCSLNRRKRKRSEGVCSWY